MPERRIPDFIKECDSCKNAEQHFGEIVLAFAKGASATCIGGTFRENLHNFIEELNVPDELKKN